MHIDRRGYSVRRSNERQAAEFSPGSRIFQLWLIPVALIWRRMTKDCEDIVMDIVTLLKSQVSLSCLANI